MNPLNLNKSAGLNKSHKINAFTLQEMLVVLVISAIIASIGFMTLRIVNLQFDRINNLRTEKNRILLLKREINVSFQSTDSVVWDSDLRKLSAYNNGEIMKFWEFKTTAINKIDDTIPLPIKTIYPYSEGKDIINGNIDALWLEFGLSKSTIPIFISKRRPVIDRSDFKWD
ncbi:type II secretion system protein J [Dokdonia sp. Hel_I_53]|uniref:PulJ/GspJ family protein n=1 Tax=Dokdonia sp. Hel_I_53 TaxID=1566287 RepID=UPI00119A6E31|nr:prepilin-type N-terminal cleavage/methylation domain-containing protein [Dokdonia sp. Hel_I_53]TVZ52262.1 prepilin-type N-terminal cleavage/methylation domain-containing protein [Dokdonia sp. Hel_I_53]